MKKITINRSKFENKYNSANIGDKCCYVGQFANQLGYDISEEATVNWAFIRDNFSEEFENNLSAAGESKDEETVTRLLNSVGYEVEFIGEYNA